MTDAERRGFTSEEIARHQPMPGDLTGLQQEAEDASVDFAAGPGVDWPTRDECFVAGYKAAAEPRDQRIADLEETLSRFTRDVLRSGRP